MTTNSHRFSTYTTTSVGTGPDSKNDEQKKDMWSSMLDNVASGKRLPEKNLIVLGGTADSQRDFVEALSDSQRRNLDRSKDKIPPIANSFALGYTYYDVLDADQDDILARVSVNFLSTPSPSFSTLLKPLLTPQSIPNTVIVILLDWAQPWSWMRQLRDWVLLVRSVIGSLSLECKDVMEETMSTWKDRGRGGSSLNLDGTGAVTAEGDVPLPLGQGEWSMPLGLPLCVVCQNAERMDLLEKTQGWKEDQFDLVLQFLRSVLMTHGASLVYTNPAMDTPLQSLVHASLGIHSLLKRAPLRHNVIDRDKIVVPPNWDSGTKIVILRDGFDVEGVTNGWEIDLDQDFPVPANTNGTVAGADPAAANGHIEEPEGSTVVLFESHIQDSSLDALHLANEKKESTRLEVEEADAQQFLSTLVLRLEEEKKADEDAAKDYVPSNGPDEAISDHIGPVQFNMGGIHVDADDMVQRLKDRQAYGQSPEEYIGTEDEEEPETKKPVDTERLAQFFGNLMNRKPAAGAK